MCVGHFLLSVKKKPGLGRLGKLRRKYSYGRPPGLKGAEGGPSDSGKKAGKNKAGHKRSNSVGGITKHEKYVLTSQINTDNDKSKSNSASTSGGGSDFKWWVSSVKSFLDMSKFKKSQANSQKNTRRRHPTDPTSKYGTGSSVPLNWQGSQGYNYEVLILPPENYIMTGCAGPAVALLTTEQ